MSENGRLPPDPRPVCFVSANLGQGGAQRAMINMANHWAAMGRKVRVVTLDDGVPAPGYEFRTEIRIEALGIGDRTDRGLADFRNLLRLARLRSMLLRDRRVVLIPMMEKVAALTLAAVYPSRVRVLASERIDPAHYDVGPFWSRMRRITYPRAERVIVQTRGAAKFFDDWLPRPPVVIPNPVLPPPCQPPPYEARPKTIGAAGRLDPQKGFEFLLSAFSASGLARRGWILRIAGEGPLEAGLKAEAGRLGLGDAARFEGWVSDMPGFLSQCRVFVLPSLYEGFPNALCEAMANGCACVSSDCPSGPSDIINSGVNGVLVAPASSEELAQVISRLADDGETASRLALSARGIVGTFSPVEIRKRWDQIVDQPGSVPFGG